jgi:phospholipase C
MKHRLAQQVAATALRTVRTGLVSASVFSLAFGNLSVDAQSSNFPSSTNSSGDNRTVTPIKHLIVIIGENRSFDHVFATYVPKWGQS